MPLDIEFLRRHYAAMSDEELESVDRADLVDAARQIYDDEVASRVSAAPATAREAVGEVVIEEDWLEDAAEVYSRYVKPEANVAPEDQQAQEALEAAGIPCELELFEEPDSDGKAQDRWRILVPGRLVHRAASVLDRDIFNPQFEADFRTHLEMLSDEELRVMQPEYAFCGLYDRLDRINRAYDDELARRQMGR